MTDPLRKAPHAAAFLLCLIVLTQSCAARRDESGDIAQIQQQLDKYTAALDAASPDLASQVWLTSPDVSLIHPAGHAHGWEEVKPFYEFFGTTFSERKLTARDVVIRTNGDTAWAEFYWHFDAKLSADGSAIQSDGRETQVYTRTAGGWRIVHVHYSGPAMVPPAP